MITSISVKFAGYATLVILFLVIVFHLSMLAGFLPSDITWGGRIESRSQLIVFEIISITVNLIMIAIVSARTGLLTNRSPRTIRIALWAMFVLFSINTMGNIFAVNEVEKIVFTPLTLLLAVFSLRLALSK